jgi:hypothetical protein
MRLMDWFLWVAIIGVVAFSSYREADNSKRINALSRQIQADDWLPSTKGSTLTCQGVRQVEGGDFVLDGCNAIPGLPWTAQSVTVTGNVVANEPCSSATSGSGNTVSINCDGVK